MRKSHIYAIILNTLPLPVRIMPYKDYEKRKQVERERYNEIISDKNSERYKRYKHLSDEYRKNNKDRINARQRELKIRKRNILIEHLGGQCVGCGTTHNLQFDHIDRANKSFTIGRCLGNKLDDLIIEANKCQLLCKSCHKIKTRAHNDTHETLKGYVLQSIVNDDDTITVTYVKG